MIYCPLCKVPMTEMSKSGVLIDVCPQCRGVWLDRGELEKIVAAGREAVRDYDDLQRYHEEHRGPEVRRHEDWDDHEHHADYPSGRYKKKKKRGIFSVFDDLFD